jgi:hypothetical protein
MSKKTKSSKSILDVDNYNLHIRTKSDDTYDVIAYFKDKRFSVNVNEVVINKMPPIIIAYPVLLKQILEKHIYSIEKNSDFFSIKYEGNLIILSFLRNIKLLEKE